MDDQSHVFIILIVEIDRSSVALVAPITSSNIITFVTGVISSQFSRWQLS